jgi:hypothetical protein
MISNLPRVKETVVTFFTDGGYCRGIHFSVIFDPVQKSPYAFGIVIWG